MLSLAHPHSAWARKVKDKEQWITAAETLRLLTPVFDSEYAAKMTICQRAHAGLIRARAERFIIDDQSAGSRKIPEDFWWAEGHTALEQNWTSGDFATWIKQKTRLRAFGVSFLRIDIERLVPPASKTTAPGVSSTLPILEPGDRPTEWDVFISHASEDKDELVRPLAASLRNFGLRVWFDEFTLTVGDSLRRSIDQGLASSRFGIVVISPNFLKKEWPQKELDGLVAREVDRIKVILPVWHNIGADEIRRYSPPLADRLAVSSDKGIDQVTSQLMQAIRKDDVGLPQTAAVSSKSPPTSSLQELRQYASEFHRRRSEQIAAGEPAVALLDGGALILHMLPLSAAGGQPSASFEGITREPRYFPPMGSTHGRDFKITYDGLLVGSNDKGLTEPQRAYVFVFRSGAIEAVVSSLATGLDHTQIVLPEVCSLLIKFTSLYAKSLYHFGVQPPMTVDVSLVNVAGMNLLQDFLGISRPPHGELDRQLLPFGQAIFDKLPNDYNEDAKLLMPILTHLANAAGLSSPPYFDAEGNYRLKL